MSYIDHINNTLKPNITEKEIVLDLFAGCGGLSLGFEAAGYKTIGYEMDPTYATTYNKNLTGECFSIKLELAFEYPKAEIIIGGPPCQPFSVGGKQKGIEDSRDGFPIFIDAVRRLQPKVFMFENVRGLLYINKWYFELILKEFKKLGYLIDYKLINAVNYGIPQNRERLFVFGHRSMFRFPKPSQHKVTVGEAIGDTMYTAPDNSKFFTPSMDAYVAKYEKASDCINPRDLYPDRPARTLTCRNLAGATGDMHRVRLQDGRRRRIIQREAARLQSFPDWFEFTGNESQQFYQIGNAVPPLLAYQMALSLKECYRFDDLYSPQEIIEKNIQPNNELILFPEMKQYINKSTKTESIQRLINEALEILESVGIPLNTKTQRGIERMAICFLAVAGVTKDWSEAKDNTNLKSRDIIRIVNQNFSEHISSGSYDDIRRKDLKLLVLADLVVNTGFERGSNPNDPTRGYSLHSDFRRLIMTYNTKDWKRSLEEFIKDKSSLAEILARKRGMKKIPVKLPSGKPIELSLGPHNVLQKAIIEDFLPIFGSDSKVLYIGDTSNKILYIEQEELKKLNFFELSHEMLPDIVAFSENNNWLYLIEAVHSSGPMSEIRVLELKKMLKDCKADLIFVTCFLTKSDFKKWITDIAWETEVWVANNPEHLVHFNGHKFLGPY